jgi:hypothetical protein
MSEISQERQNAIRVMHSLGWTWARNGKFHEFRQPDTGGLWDVIKINHDALSVASVLRKVEAYEPTLSAAVVDARAEWLKSRGVTA